MKQIPTLWKELRNNIHSEILAISGEELQKVNVFCRCAEYRRATFSTFAVALVSFYDTL
jgi:hypothetical protein